MLLADRRRGLAKGPGRLVLPLVARRQALSQHGNHRLRRAAAKYFRVLICLEPGLQGAIAGSSIPALTMKGSAVRDIAAADNNCKVIANSVMGTGCAFSGMLSCFNLLPLSKAEAGQ